MLLFRSEETIKSWCAARHLPVRPGVTLPKLWILAKTWYDNRLTPDSRRPKPDEMVQIFASIGLTGPFWDPTSDHW